MVFCFCGSLALAFFFCSQNILGTSEVGHESVCFTVSSFSVGFSLFFSRQWAGFCLRMLKVFHISGVIQYFASYRHRSNLKQQRFHKAFAAVKVGTNLILTKDQPDSFDRTTAFWLNQARNSLRWLWMFYWSIADYPPFKTTFIQTDSKGSFCANGSVKKSFNHLQHFLNHL